MEFLEKMGDYQPFKDSFQDLRSLFNYYFLLRLKLQRLILKHTNARWECEDYKIYSSRIQGG